MKDEHKTQGQLVNKLAEMRQRLAELGAADTECKRAEQEIVQRNQELNVLNEIGQALSRLVEPSEIFELVYTMVGRVLDNRDLYIALYDEAKQQLTFPVFTKDGQRLEPYTRPFANSITEHVIRTKKPLLIPCDVEETTAKLGLQLKRRTPVPASLLGVPMLVGEKVLGVIMLQDYYNEYAYNTKHLELLSTFAAQAAIAIENARLYREAEGRAEAMEQLNQSLWALQETSQVVSSTLTIKEVLRTVRENIASILPGAEPLFALVDEERQLIRPTLVFPDNPVLEFVRRIIGARLEELALPLSELTNRQQEDFLAGKVRVVRQLSEGLGRLLSEPVLAAVQKVLGIKVLVSAPLLSRGNLLGIMLVFARQEVGPPELGLLKSLAQQAAIAIENARLFEEEKRRATQLGLINEVGDKAASILDLDRLIQEVPHSIQEKFNYYNVALFLLDEERREVVMQAVAGGFEHIVPGEYRQVLDEGIIGFVARSGNSWLANDISKDPYYVKGFLGEVLTKSELCVPIKLGDKVIGALDVQSIRLNDFDQADVAAMEAVADQVAIAIENARLYEAAQDELAERKRVEEALAEERNLLRTIIDNLPDLIYVKDTESRYVVSNTAHVRFLGATTPDEVVGKTVFELYPQELAEQYYADDQKVIQSGQPLLKREERSVDEMGNNVWNLTTKVPLRDSLGKIVGIVGIASDITERKQAEEDLQQSYLKLQKTLKGTINTLVSAIEMRDPYTAGHQWRVTQLACAIAKEMGLSEEQIEGLRMAGLVHDIGKMNVPAEILSKPGKLNDLEFGLIKAHTQVGHNILDGTVEFPWPVAQIVLQHHERIDGSGYPQGLSGDDVILEARILAVADVVEAMASHRPYRPPRGIDKALEEISQNKGVLYDPEVVDVCLKLFTEKGFKFEQR